MTADLTAADPASDGKATRWWVTVAVAAAFGLLYAFDLFEAISNLLGVAQLNSIATEAGIAVPVPWVLPITTVALPPVVYLLAVLIGRRHRIGMRALVFAGGLAVVAALTLSLTALA